MCVGQRKQQTFSKLNDRYQLSNGKADLNTLALTKGHWAPLCQILGDTTDFLWDK